MISKVTFNGQYRFPNKNKTRSYESHIASRVLHDNIIYLKDKDEMNIHSSEKYGYILTVPNYMDKNIETYCLYSGIEYIKY